MSFIGHAATLMFLLGDLGREGLRTRTEIISLREESWICIAKAGSCCGLCFILGGYGGGVLDLNVYLF